jgi:adenylate cyclase
VVVIRLLGGASVSRSGTLVSGRATYGFRLALLAILAAARGRPVTRDRIVALLWPESPTDRARHQLSDTLYILRAALGDEAIRAIGDDLALDTDVISSDVVEFGQLIEAEDLDRAVELYAGPLLDGFHLSDAPDFERWLDNERLRLDQDYARALERLAGRSEEAGDCAGAVAWWRRLAAHDPHSGRIALGLMRALEAAGDRAGALRHARLHTELMQEEFAAHPDGDVVAFAERLRIAPAPRPTPQPVAEASPVQPLEHAAVEREDAAVGRSVSARPQRTRVYGALAPAILVVSILVGIVYGASRRSPPAALAEHSVAVLPFVHLSDERGFDYFSDGLSEQIISVLSRVPGLRVAARTSSFALRDEKLDIRTIGDTLNVTAVLEGSVRRDGDRLRITAQLIDARSGYHIWSGDFDRQMQDVVDVQDEIAREIARALELRLPVARREARSSRTPDLQAYDLYLRALHLRDTFTPEALQQAREFLNRAIELDPEFALAHALKATVLGPAMLWRYTPLDAGLAEARAAIARALELDPGLGEAHAALGMIKLFFEFEYPAAEQALRRALDLNENDHLAWHMLANYYSAMGRPGEAADARARGAALDPFNPRIGIMLAVAYTDADRFPEALAQYDRMLKLHAMHPIALGLGSMVPAGPARVYLKQGRQREAVEDYVRVAMLRGATAPEVDSLRTSFERGGLPAFWDSWLTFDLRHAGSDPDPVRAATLYALAGDTARSLAWLERAHAERNASLVFVFADPTFASLREQPRFRQIFRQLNFPDS